jgi:predicted Zn finger-like uncharacterized protein
MSSEWRNPPGAGPTMRITCPNCGAQYEVDDALIPEAGRDVQCSNCGKGWFQARHVAADAPEEAVEAAAEDEPVAEAVAEVEEAEGVAAEPVAEPVAETDEAEPAAEAEEPEAEAGLADDASEEVETAPEHRVAEDTAAADPMDDEDEDEDDAPPPALPAAAQPRKPEESVLAVLREEAQREIAQRRQEAGGIESQPDLGLAEPIERRTGPAPADIAAGAAVASTARRDLLPDIDEINSTLRSDAERAAYPGEDEGVEGERRRGFRMGFGLMILLAAVLIGLYAGSAWLAQAVPALEPALIAYVEMANGLRAWIDGLLAAGVDGLSG